MDTSSNSYGQDTLQFDVRGVTIIFHPHDSISSPESYAVSRLPMSNGHDALADRGLVVEMQPDGFEGHDTFIAPGVQVGTGVKIGAHSQLFKGVVIGPGATIGRGCTLEADVHVGTKTSIGEDNFIPKGLTIGNDVVIPKGLFRPGQSVSDFGRRGFVINQAFVDAQVDLSRTVSR